MDYKKDLPQRRRCRSSIVEKRREEYERYKYYFKFEPLDSLQLGEGMVDVGSATAKRSVNKLNIPIEEVKAAILAEHADWAEPGCLWRLIPLRRKRLTLFILARPSREAN